MCGGSARPDRAGARKGLRQRRGVVRPLVAVRAVVARLAVWVAIPPSKYLLRRRRWRDRRAGREPGLACDAGQRQARRCAVAHPGRRWNPAADPGAPPLPPFSLGVGGLIVVAVIVRRGSHGTEQVAAMSSGTRRAIPGCVCLVGLVDPLSQERALGGVRREFERSLVGDSSLLAVAEFAEQLGAGGVVEVVAFEGRGEGFQLR